jgi:hypothetical protein
MKQYKVFTRSGSTVLVKQGWSWPAFLLPAIWALTKRLWGVGAGVLFGSIALAFVIDRVDIDRAEPAFVLMGIEFFVRIIFGMNGNSWREVNLISRGFTESHKVAVGPSRSLNPAGWKWLARYPQLNAFWHDPVWSKVIASGIAGVAALVLAAVAYVYSGKTSKLPIDLRQPKYIATCNTAVLEGDVETYDNPTVVWFEWGLTPELGITTMQQTFTKDADFYQHLTGLTENTRYYYRAVAENMDGRAEGQVGVFVTSRCESTSPTR